MTIYIITVIILLVFYNKYWNSKSFYKRNEPKSNLLICMQLKA